MGQPTIMMTRSKLLNPTLPLAANSSIMNASKTPIDKYISILI